MKKNFLTRLLTASGAVLVWLPILAPLIFSIIRLVSTGQFGIDYLMPAELGLSVLAGAGLLLWAAIRSRLFVKWIAISIGVALALLFGSQGVALLTGLASGVADPSGWRLAITMAMLIGYDLAVILLGIGGFLLMRELFHQPKAQP